jgi:(E)-4-hydroxy-3-methylbut-2-enyl-diphosphate synthase
MYDKGWDYPLHLGVTEAGEGEDGRTKSALGIGALLADGLGDTIRVSLTEDPELEMQPCGLLAKTGMDACEKGLGVDNFAETHRDFKSFERRQGEMPPEGTPAAQFLHRDGTVFSAVSVEDLREPEALYAALGCKMAVGMPFKDIASSDSLYGLGWPSALGFGAPDREADDDDDRHEGRGRDGGPGHAVRGRGGRPGAHHGAGEQGGQRVP